MFALVCEYTHTTPFVASARDLEQAREMRQRIFGDDHNTAMRRATIYCCNDLGIMIEIESRDNPQFVKPV